MIRNILLCIAVSLCLGCLSAQNIDTSMPLELIIQDIYETALENDVDVDLETLEQELQTLREQPINLNDATEKQLQQLPFLSQEQIDAILLYAYQREIHSLYELQLIPSLKSYDIRNMLPFVYIGPRSTEQTIYWREDFHNAKHKLTLRADARNLESKEYDPFFLSIKYLCDANHVQFGCAMERDPGEPWWNTKTYGFDYYGGFVQFNQLSRHLTKWIIGDYRATFGLGLVLGSPTFIGGKQVAVAGRQREGITRHLSTQEYNFYRGTAATLSWSNIELTALYSARRVDANLRDDATFPSVQTTGYHRTDSEIAHKQAVWQHTVAMNLSAHYKQVKFGLTLKETLFNHRLVPDTNYYNANYFQGKEQFAAGLNYRWSRQRFSLFGEVATAQNRRWGFANITGFRLAPINDLVFSAIYRYYSPTYDVFNANAFGESSRNNDEHGIYLGAEVSLVARWRFSAYTDVFSFRYPKYGIKTPSTGVEALLQADFATSEELQMQWRARVKEKADRTRAYLRYYLDWQRSGWRLRTQLEGSIAKEEEEPKPTFGVMLAEDCSYQFQRVPILLQLRLQAFYAPDYQNRFYTYENDVLYAFSIPAVYGIGARYYLNLRYKINHHWAIYCKVSQTVYSNQWTTTQDLASNRRTDIHLLLRLTY